MFFIYAVHNVSFLLYFALWQNKKTPQHKSFQHIAYLLQKQLCVRRGKFIGIGFSEP